MAAMIWDSAAGAFKDATPMILDEQNQAYKDSTGFVWNESAQAWEERWGGVTAYVYGAALETITIKQNGVTVGQVSTDVNGKSTQQIPLACGAYDLTGSVSGWTETQTVDSNTERLRAMPERVLYWYGNGCTWITGGFRMIKNQGMYKDNSAFKPKEAIFETNLVRIKSRPTTNYTYYTNIVTKNKISINSGNIICCRYNQITNTYDYEPMLVFHDDNNYYCNGHCIDNNIGHIGRHNSSYGEAVASEDITYYVGLESNAMREVEVKALWIK